MTLFLSAVSVAEAIGTVREITRPLEAESVPLKESFGRVLAADIHSDIDIPAFDRSSVDGFAVIAAETSGASDAMPSMLNLIGRVRLGGPERFLPGPGDTVYIPTGGPLPDGMDAVVMAEYSEEAGPMVLVKRPVADGENVVHRGEDFSKGEKVLPAGRRISPRDAGVLAAVGSSMVPVIRVPVIGIISTGNELVPVDQVPPPGFIRDSNSYLCGAFTTRSGAIPRYYPIIRDDRDAIRAALTSAAEQCDAILCSGGSSKDERDMTAGVIADLGIVLVHGIAIAPGKPTIIGRIGTVPVIGLPGHPASAFVILLVIGAPMLDALMGKTPNKRGTVEGILTRNVPSSRGREDYLRVSVEDGAVTPLFGKSGLLNTLVWSDGVVRIPAGSEGLEKGARVEVLLW